jgi:hypothetical protein
MFMLTKCKVWYLCYRRNRADTVNGGTGGVAAPMVAAP